MCYFSCSFSVSVSVKVFDYTIFQFKFQLLFFSFYFSYYYDFSVSVSVVDIGNVNRESIGREAKLAIAARVTLTCLHTSAATQPGELSLTALT